MDEWFRVWNLGSGFEGLGFRVWDFGSGFDIQGTVSARQLKWSVIFPRARMRMCRFQVIAQVKVSVWYKWHYDLNSTSGTRSFV